MRAEHRQTRPRMAGWNAHQKREVVVENHGMHGLGGDVDHVRFRIAQPNQQKQQPLLVEGGADKFSKLALVQRHRWNDYRRVAPVVAGRECAPDVGKAWLERSKAASSSSSDRSQANGGFGSMRAGRSSCRGRQSAHYGPELRSAPVE